MDLLSTGSGESAPAGAIGRACVRCAVMVGLAVAGAGCNAIVGVDFGKAHLADGGAELDGLAPKVDGAAPADAHDGAADGGPKGDASIDARPSDATVDGSGCDPTAPPSTAPCVIDEAYGVFVAPAPAGSDAAGDGSRAHPFATLGYAVLHASGKRVYACGATYPEHLVVGTASDGVGIYGGLSCPAPPPPDAGDTGDAGGAVFDASTDGKADAAGAAEAGQPVDAADAGSAGEAGVAGAGWTYNGVRATVEPVTPGYALEVTQLVTGAHLEDMAFRSADASPLSGSTSSIAVLVNASPGVSFARADVRAGNGLPGTTTPAAAPNACTTSLAGLPNSVTTPGVGGSCKCPVFGLSAGGAGVATTRTNVPANDGTSTPTPSPVVAPHDGLPGTSSITRGACTAGDPGAPGAAGTAGLAGVAGTISTVGWGASPGGAGVAGGPGEGGGGGGATLYAGAGGGSGGCGGSGGEGGIPGGASIAVAIIASHVSLTTVTLETGSGGGGATGGAGEAGQAGGPGGTPAPLGLGYSCAGGAGGAGGGGGGGGGGAGGPSAGVAWTGGTAPTFDGMLLSTASTLPSPSTFVGAPAGAGGPGGAGGAAATGGVAGAAGGDGPAGVAGAVVPF